jgi:hypothetical protein
MLRWPNSPSSGESYTDLFTKDSFYLHFYILRYGLEAVLPRKLIDRIKKGYII